PLQLPEVAVCTEKNWEVVDVNRLEAFDLDLDFVTARRHRENAEHAAVVRHRRTDDPRRGVGGGDSGTRHHAVLVDNGAVDDTGALCERTGRPCEEDREGPRGETHNPLSSNHGWLRSHLTIR